MKSSLWTKAIWFRLAVMAVDFVILSFFLNSLFLSGMATLLRHAIQTLLYWYHERVWQRHDWGMENGDTKWRTLAKTVTFRLLTSGKDLLVIPSLPPRSREDSRPRWSSPLSTPSFIISSRGSGQSET